MNQRKIKDDYFESINQVLQFIDDNIDLDLSLERLAEIALFSRFHFHRIFKGVIGESVNSYVIRRRLERAATLFKHDPQLTVTQVALQVGFNSPEHFSRSFREKFGITANEFRSSDSSDPDSPKNRKIYQAISAQSFYHVYEESRELEPVEFEGTIREFPEFQVAFISEAFGEDGMQLVKAWQDLMDWATERNFLAPQARRFAISRDDIEITPAEQYRMEFCIAVPPGTRGAGRVGIGRVCGGTYLVIPVRGDIHRVAQAWDYMYKVLLPKSDFRPVDEPAIEIFMQGPETIGWEQFDLEIGVPVSRTRRS